MRLTTSIIDKLSDQYPEFTFEKSDHFAWNPDNKVIFYGTDDKNSLDLLLHEVSHGILGHDKYHRDVDLLSMEAEAWEKAKDLAEQFDNNIKEDTVQDHLDTYREWMHARSLCPKCSATGSQEKGAYKCIACGNVWRTNEARLCGLRRYSVKTK